jgi:hypothetical protein
MMHVNAMVKSLLCSSLHHMNAFEFENQPVLTLSASAVRHGQKISYSAKFSNGVYFGLFGHEANFTIFAHLAGGEILRVY